MVGTAKWFATSLLSLDDLNNPTWARHPEATLLHAKRTGTVGTACGRNAETWHKHWVTFDPTATPNACRACVLAVAEASRPRSGAMPFASLAR
jgi:hypothetical protein